MTKLEQACDILKDMAEARLIFNSKELDWKAKFDLIFSYDFEKRIRDLGISFEKWWSDSSCQDDVTAFWSALEETIKSVDTLVKVLGGGWDR